MSMVNAPAPSVAAPAPAPSAPAAAPEASPSMGASLREAAAARTARRASRGGKSSTPAVEPASHTLSASPSVSEATPKPPPAPSTASTPQASATEPNAAAPSAEGDTEDVDVNALRQKAARAVHAARQHERRFREMEQRTKELESQLASVDGDSPWKGSSVEQKIAFAQKHGLGLREWTEHVLAQKGKGPDPQAQQSSSGESEAIAALRAELDELKGASKQRQEREQQTQAEQLRTQELGVIERACQANEQWKLVAEFGRIETVYDRFYELQAQQGYAPRLPDVLDEVAEKLVGGTKQLLRHDAVRALAKSDPELFAELRSVFAAESQAAAASEAAPAPESRAPKPRKPRTITHADASDTTERRAPQRATYADRKRNAVARLQSMRATR